MDIQQRPIADFLDAADTVLNSNTFLLAYPPAYPGNILGSLKDYLTGTRFQAELLQQDLDRGWYNMHVYNDAADRFVPRPGTLMKPNLGLVLMDMPVTTREYLMGMLMADPTMGPFFSAYGKQKDRHEAARITDAFLAALLGGQPVETFYVTPDFLYNWNDVQQLNGDHLHYFEGAAACDTATLLCLPQTHFLLLTNGID